MSGKSTESADGHLKIQLAMSKDMGWKDANALNLVAARTVLQEDLGRFSGHLQVYGLDDDTRDRLLAHARQDAAHALSNTATLLDQVKGLRRTMLGLVIAILFAVLSLPALLLFH